MLDSVEMRGFAETMALIRSFQVTKMLEVAASLDLAAHIGDEPRPTSELAEACGADAVALLRLCRALSAFGVFSVDSEGRVTHTERSRWLRRDANPTLYHTARYWGMPSTWAVWGELEKAIRTGKAQFEPRLGAPFFDYLGTHADEAALFDAFMQFSPDDRHAAVSEAYDFSSADIVVDIGGGNGALLRAILSRNPGVRGILFDQEKVVAGAILGECASRCTIDAGDFFDRVSSGGDIYTMSQVLHDWNDDNCVRILRNCRAAMSGDARLLVIERVLDETPGRTIPMNYLADMHMMMLFPGAKERTPKEYAELLVGAGFHPPQILPTRSAYCIIETSVM
jgi:hypothetical protein